LDRNATQKSHSCLSFGEIYCFLRYVTRKTIYVFVIQKTL